MKCALTTQNLLSLQQLSFIYRPLIGRPCVNTQLLTAHECTHQQPIDDLGQFANPPPHPSKGSDVVGMSSRSSPRKASFQEQSGPDICAPGVAPSTFAVCWRTLQMMLCPTDFAAGADPLSTTAEHFATNWSRWLDSAPLALHWGGDWVPDSSAACGIFQLASWLDQICQPTWFWVRCNAS